MSGAFQVMANDGESPVSQAVSTISRRNTLVLGLVTSVAPVRRSLREKNRKESQSFSDKPTADAAHHVVDVVAEPWKSAS
jgi:hypothetical protein